MYLSFKIKETGVGLGMKVLTGGSAYLIIVADGNALGPRPESATEVCRQKVFEAGPRSVPDPSFPFWESIVQIGNEPSENLWWKQ